MQFRKGTGNKLTYISSIELIYYFSEKDPMMNLWIVTSKRLCKHAMRIMTRLDEVREFKPLRQVEVCTAHRLLDGNRYLAGTDGMCLLRQV